MKFKSDIEVQAGLKDKDGQLGTAGQLLSSTGTQTDWIDQSTIIAAAATEVDIEVKNLDTVTLAKGTPVYIVGTVGTSSRLQIAAAKAGDPAKMPSIGLLKQSLAVNGEGFVTVTGILKNITTDPIDGVTPNEGDTLYIKSTGGLTTVKPTGATNEIQNVGKVGRVQGTSAGSMVVSCIMRSNDVPNLPTGKIWVGDGNTIVSDTVFLDEPNGRMGIGATSPNAKLDVDGAGNFSGGTVVSGIDTSTDVGVAISKGDYLYSNDGSYLRRLIGQQSGGSIDIGQQGTGLISNINFFPGTSGNIDFFGSGSIDMRVASSGNVGIGTTSPTANLHVQGSSATDVPIIRSGGFGNSGSKLELAETLAAGGDMNYGFSFFNDGNVSNTLQIKSHNNSTTGVTAMSIGRADALTTFGTVPIVGTRTAGDNTTYAASTAFVTSAVAGVPISDYLPLTAGSSFPLTGDLYAGTSTAGTDRFIRTYYSDSTYTEMRGYGIITNRAGSYYRPANDKTQVLSIGNDGNTWNYVSQNANYHVFGKDTSEWMRIDTSGNVGIGTTNPVVTLDVQGSIFTRGGLYFTPNGSTSSVPTWGMLLNAAGDLVIDDTTGPQNVIFSNSGNVGIGTTAPGTKLEVRGTDPLLELNTISATGNPYMMWSQAGTRRSYMQHVDSGDNLTIASEYGGMVFMTGTSGSESERMRITSIGNVGIGITNPSARIHAEYSGLAGKFVSSQSTGLEVQGGGNGQPIARFKDTSASEKVTIASTGSVGIGDTSPSTKLSVNGGVQIADEPAAASAALVGTLRYRSTANTSFVDMCMQTGSTTYTWVNIVSNFW